MPTFYTFLFTAVLIREITYKLISSKLIENSSLRYLCTQRKYQFFVLKPLPARITTNPPMIKPFVIASKEVPCTCGCT